MNTRQWLAEHSTAEELTTWGAVTARALVTLIDTLEEDTK